MVIKFERKTELKKITVKTQRPNKDGFDAQIYPSI